MVPEARNRVGWVAHPFRLGAEAMAHAFGAVRVSQRLHWTEDAARCEAEAWAGEMHLGSPSWETVDEAAAVAWVGMHGFVVATTMLN
jgi:hypothetical protein